ncbi:hypothetical protein ABEB36_006209 [Hypothenemus hampei]|uniref:C2H2-type domain-containing protein n=1 Tax=Hypothenemus hampei TaxID=57062 RepID=A0ABD1EPR5_HYPHA
MKLTHRTSRTAAVMRYQEILSYFEESERDDIDDDHDNTGEDESLRCLHCDVTFVDKQYWHNHHLYHVREPYIKVERTQINSNPPLKITLKTGKGNTFEIVSPIGSPAQPVNEIEENKKEQTAAESEETPVESERFVNETLDELQESDFGVDQESGENSTYIEYEENCVGDVTGNVELQQEETDEDRNSVHFSPNLVDTLEGNNFSESPSSSTASIDQLPVQDNFNLQPSCSTTPNVANSSPSYGNIPGGEPTPPPEPSPTGSTEYPKIKIKTTGLFKDPKPPSCTISEIISDDTTTNFNNSNVGPAWPVSSSSSNDSLKLPGSDSLLSVFNNERSNKDLSYSTNNDNEFISLDTFNERNRGSMQIYSGPNTVPTSNALDTLTGLPMQALAQQVSRLNSSNQGMHQQNVLINIQQFPTQPQQPYPVQHQPMYPPPYPTQPPLPQYSPYQPPNHLYPPYGPPPVYAAAPHLPPPPQMGQRPMRPPPHPGQNALGSSSSTSSSSESQQSSSTIPQNYRPPPNRHHSMPRGTQIGTARMSKPTVITVPGNRGPVMSLVRPRGSVLRPVRGRQLRVTTPVNGVRMPMGKRSTEKSTQPVNSSQAKKKRVDVLTPSDKDDDDCQVIYMQPKNTGLPQIENVQGGSESVENSIMKLSDSITLSLRNPSNSTAKPTGNQQQKSEATAVASVLASRGITVTPSGKPKEPASTQIPTALSLNGSSVSIVAKTSTKPSNSEQLLPTVDLTEEASAATQPAQNQGNRTGLPYRCDLCSAQYPNATGLNKHRITYHKTTGGICELGIPLVNVKLPGIMQKLCQLGITQYIPLSNAGADGLFALPVVSSKNTTGNIASLGTTQMLSLGPVRSIVRSQTSKK